MDRKKSLVKIALGALILASVAPFDGQAHQAFEASGTYLAAGCPSHGCNTMITPNQANVNGTYNSVSDYNQVVSNDAKNREISKEKNSFADNEVKRPVEQSSASSQNLTEAQLLNQLDDKGKAIYLSLDPASKALAIQLASQETYKDKNLAVREAQRRMNESRGLINR